MLEYFRRVESTGEELIVTDRGVPVLKVLPLHKKITAAELFSDVRGKVHLPEKELLESTEIFRKDYSF